LAAVAAIDGRIAQPEMQLLVRKAKEMRLDPPQVQQILQEAREGRLPLALPSEPREYDERLGEIIDVVCVDGRIETQERALLLRFASRMNLDEADLMARVRPILQAAQQRLSGGRAPQPPQPAPAPTRPSVTELMQPPPPPAPPRRVTVFTPPPPPPASPPRLERRPEPMLTIGVGMSDIKDEVISAPPKITGTQDSLTSTPGPVSLGGFDAMAMLSAEVSPVMLQLLKSQLEHEDMDAVVQYAKRYLNVAEDAAARAVVDRVIHDHPDWKLRGQR
jgi:hypothetical protein